MGTRQFYRNKLELFGAFLVAAIFVGFGSFATWHSISGLADEAAMKTWVDVPAFVTQADLKIHRGKGTSYQVRANYVYEFGGREFAGNRVAIETGGDNIGDFQRATYEQLLQARDQKRAIHCFVNPKNPRESILYRDIRADVLLSQAIGGAFGGSIGIAVITYLIVRTRNLPSYNASAPDNEPWCAWSDWAAGEIRPSGSATLVVQVVFAAMLWWILASLPVMLRFRSTFQQINSNFRWFIFALPIVIVVLLATLVYQWLRAAKYGVSLLRLVNTPGVIGGQLAGFVQIPQLVNCDDGFLFKLKCLQRRGSGRGAHDKAIWQQVEVVFEPITDYVTNTTAIPVSFTIPDDCEPTSVHGKRNGVRWRLDVSAKVPGVDYKTWFEVPVFRTSNSQPIFASI